MFGAIGSRRECGRCSRGGVRSRPRRRERKSGRRRPPVRLLPAWFFAGRGLRRDLFRAIFEILFRTEEPCRDALRGLAAGCARAELKPGQDSFNERLLFKVSHQSSKNPIHCHASRCRIVALCKVSRHGVYSLQKSLSIVAGDFMATNKVGAELDVLRYCKNTLLMFADSGKFRNRPFECRSRFLQGVAFAA